MFKSIHKDGYWEGEIWNRRKNGEIYPEWLSISSIMNDKNEIQQYIGVFSDISDRKKYEMDIIHQANHDSLTDLANRRAFTEKIEYALKICERSKLKAAILYLDIDHFKTINDKFGHLTGDKLLEQVAGRLKTCVRSSDVIARLGGDEFAIMLYDASSRKYIDAIAKHLFKTLAAPYTLNDQKIPITLSMGIAIYPDDAVTMENLIKLSDETMYNIKKSTRNAYAFWSQSE